MIEISSSILDSFTSFDHHFFPSPIHIRHIWYDVMTKMDLFSVWCDFRSSRWDYLYSANKVSVTIDSNGFGDTSKMSTNDNKKNRCTVLPISRTLMLHLLIAIQSEVAKICIISKVLSLNFDDLLWLLPIMRPKYMYSAWSCHEWFKQNHCSHNSDIHLRQNPYW